MLGKLQVKLLIQERSRLLLQEVSFLFECVEIYETFIDTDFIIPPIMVSFLFAFNYVISILLINFFRMNLINLRYMKRLSIQIL